MQYKEETYRVLFAMPKLQMVLVISGFALLLAQASTAGLRCVQINQFTAYRLGPIIAVSD
jgi:hypothetical protein